MIRFATALVAAFLIPAIALAQNGVPNASVTKPGVAPAYVQGVQGGGSNSTPVAAHDYNNSPTVPDYTSTVTASPTSAGWTQQIATTPTVTASAYSAGNCLGGFNAVTVVGNNGESGLITNFRVASVSGVTGTIQVYLFDSQPSSSTCTDHGTFTLATTDVDKLISNPVTDTVTLATVNGSSTPAIGTLNFQPPRPFVAGGSNGSGVKTVYFALVTTTSYTPGSTSDIHTRIGVVQN